MKECVPRVGITLLSLAFVVGCGSAPRGRPETAAETAAILPRPYTAEQIRGEWIPGFTITLLQRTTAGPSLERRSVLSADDEGLEIEYAPLDLEGNPAGEPRRKRSTWVELRDHATFPADSARREEAAQETPLGTLDGWLYTVRDADEGTTTELFFARSTPGAPIQMRTTRAGELVLELIQIERHRPE